MEEIASAVSSRYTLEKNLGNGSYGVIWKGVDKSNNKEVTIKKICGAFKNPVDAQRTYREVAYLKKLLNSALIIKLYDVLLPCRSDDLYLIYEFVEANLDTVIQANVLQPVHKRYVIYQVLVGLNFLHSASIVHRDIKPSNILINSDCAVRICDFGLVRSYSSGAMSDCVASLWYRAPENLLGAQHYDAAIDIWGSGCVFGEMVLGEPLFKGQSTADQIVKIIEFTGMPTKEDATSIDCPFAFQFLTELEVDLMKDTFAKRMQNEDLGFLRTLLHFSPRHRPTARDALSNQYLELFHDASKEPTSPNPITVLLDDTQRYSADVYRKTLLHEVLQETQKTLATHHTQTSKIDTLDKTISVKPCSEDYPNNKKAVKGSNSSKPIGTPSLSQTRKRDIKPTKNSSTFSNTHKPNASSLPLTCHYNYQQKNVLTNSTSLHEQKAQHIHAMQQQQQQQQTEQDKKRKTLSENHQENLTKAVNFKERTHCQQKGKNTKPLLPSKNQPNIQQQHAKEVQTTRSRSLAYSSFLTKKKADEKMPKAGTSSYSSSMTTTTNHQEIKKLHTSTRSSVPTTTATTVTMRQKPQMQTKSASKPLPLLSKTRTDAPTPKENTFIKSIKIKQTTEKLETVTPAQTSKKQISHESKSVKKQGTKAMLSSTSGTTSTFSQRKLLPSTTQRAPPNAKNITGKGTLPNASISINQYEKKHPTSRTTPSNRGSFQPTNSKKKPLDATIHSKATTE